MLALLALRAGEVVTADWLIDQVWGDRPSRGARGALQSYVSRLRGLAPPDSERMVPHHPGGYGLDPSVVEVDTSRFVQLSEHGRAQGIAGQWMEALQADTNLDWCGFAKWSSHTVGLDLDPSLPGTRIQELATLTGLPDDLRGLLAQMLAEGRNVEGKLALKALRAGNALIFFEMGSIFAHLLERLPERRQPTPTSDAEFAHEIVETVTDARRRRFQEPLGPDVLESPDTTRSLEPAIVFYLRAAREPDHRAELLLAGSMLFSVYEQTRADRLITIGTCAPVRAGLLPLLSLLEGSDDPAGRQRWLLARRADQHPLVSPIERSFARLLTDLALVVEVADGHRVRLGHPELLGAGVTTTLPEVRSVLEPLIATADRLEPDWVELDYRLGFIARYFTAFQQDQRLTSKPPTAA